MNYYEVLGVSKTATQDEIKSAFRKLAMAHHPDKGGDETKFKEINEAYETLKDADKRASYDRFGSAGPKQSFRQNGMDDIEEILRARGFHHPFFNMDDFFNGGMRQRNHNVNLNYQISLEDAFAGKQTELSYTVGGVPHTVKLTVPPGVDTGMKFRYPGKGDATIKDAAPGDLYITVFVQDHPTFLRDGARLGYKLAVNALDAILGWEPIIPTIDGRELKVKVPAGVQHGQVLRVPNRGMPIPGGDQRGDMLIEINIVTPQILDPKLKKALEKVRDKIK
jgi:curved DNA-binding protein